MTDRIKGLAWLRPMMVHRNFFDHHCVCYWIARIAGGEPSQYRRRASKMIVEAKSKGQIVTADGCKRYYKFVVPNAKVSGARDD